MAKANGGPRRGTKKAEGTNIPRRVSALEHAFVRLEATQHVANQRLGRIEKTLETSSHLFELMHERLEHLEVGQQALVEGQQALVEGQKLVVDRLDRLVEASTRDRTLMIERTARLEARVDAIEKRLDD